MKNEVVNECSAGTVPVEQNISLAKSRSLSTAQFILFSLFGIFMFFVNITIGGVKAIPVQHLTNLINRCLAPIIPYYALAMVTGGAILPFVMKTYKRSVMDIVFTAAKIIGVLIAIMAVFQVGPALLLQPSYIPFLFNSIVIPIVVMFPVMGVGFVALLNYGLPEFLGAFMKGFMRKIWKTPGESAVDAIVSFSGGYALAVLVTNSFYKRGIYTAKESVIVATGFSTVAISFLLIIANALGLTEYWNLYFFTCFFVTFSVTAITARIYPISRIPDTYYDKPAPACPVQDGTVLSQAMEQGVSAAQKADPFLTLVKNYYLGDAIGMGCTVTASILSIGLAGILLANLTPLFDIIGYIFYPFTCLLQLPEPMLAAKAAAIEIAEMFLPSLLVASAPLITKFTIAVTSVTAVLFFSASIPSLLSTDIPVTMKDVLLIWVERTILSLFLAAGIGWMFLV